MLSKSGLNVTTAENGYEALKACELDKPDLIIMDLIMPVMDGIEASCRIRENPELCNIPIIALSTSATQHFPELCRINDYLMKPINAEQLLNKISKYINNTAAKESHISSKTMSENITSPKVESDVLIDLKNKVTPWLENLETSIIIGNVKNLASILISFGHQHQLELVYTEGEELMKSVESYNIIKIRSKLEQIREANLGGWTA
jgi:CheY-like chemotaxis protein